MINHSVITNIVCDEKRIVVETVIGETIKNRIKQSDPTEVINNITHNICGMLNNRIGMNRRRGKGSEILLKTAHSLVQ